MSRAHALAALLAGVEHRHPRAQRARVDAQERDGPHGLVVHQLEDERAHGFLIVGRTGDSHLGVRSDALDRRKIRRRGQVVDDRIQQHLHTLLLEGGPAEHWDKLPLERARAKRALQLLLRDLLHPSLHVLAQDSSIHLRARLDEPQAQGLRLGAQRLGDLPGLGGLSRLRVEEEGPPAQQIHHAAELRAGPDGQLHRHRVRIQALADGLHAHGEVRAHLVHLVEEGDARHSMPIGLVPHRLGLRLHALAGVEHRHRPIQDAQGALHLDGEVHVSRRVQDVDAVWSAGEGPRIGLQKAVVAAEVMVMPRCFSCTIQSSSVEPARTSPMAWMRPVKKRMRSVSVVLPASMWAMMPMLR